MPTRSTSRTISSSGQAGSQNLVIPFYDVTIPGESSTGLSSAGLFSGTATERFSTSLPRAELDGTMKVLATGPWRLDVLGGFRYFRLHENYTFSTSSPSIPPRIVDILTQDEFDTNDNFCTHRVRAFAVPPELGLTVGYQVAPWASIFAGYNFIYTNNVVRAPQAGEPTDQSQRPARIHRPVHAGHRACPALVQVQLVGLLGSRAHRRSRLPLLDWRPIRGSCGDRGAGNEVPPALARQRGLTG